MQKYDIDFIFDKDQSVLLSIEVSDFTMAHLFSDKMKELLGADYAVIIG